MSTLIRYNPFDESFDDFFRGFFVRPMALENPATGQIPMDVKEEDGAYLVSAEIPGVSKDDIQVAIDGNRVSISAETKSAGEVGGKILRSERHYGKSYRSFALAQDVDEATAQAKYANGVLELRLPKKSAPSVRTLAIQ
jgi:HSP20 family protein